MALSITRSRRVLFRLLLNFLQHNEDSSSAAVAAAVAIVVVFCSKKKAAIDLRSLLFVLLDFLLTREIGCRCLGAHLL